MKKLIALAALLVATLAMGATQAGSWGNAEWVFQMTGPGDGLEIRANDGPNAQVFTVFDHLQAPIFAVNKAGGAGVFGDNFKVYPGGDVYHAAVTVSPEAPPVSECPRVGMLWIGGPQGRIWRCSVVWGGAVLWFPSSLVPGG